MGFGYTCISDKMEQCQEVSESSEVLQNKSRLHQVNTIITVYCLLLFIRKIDEIHYTTVHLNKI